ncbi:MAG: restriction endonuclease subunit S [bacterium]
MTNVSKKIDVDINYQKIIKDLLKRYIPNTEVWAYGSRVKWTSKPQSDLDMVVFASKEEKIAASNLKEAFEESSLPFRVDLFIWDEVPEQFHDNIKKEHVVLQSVEAEKNIPSEWTEYRLGEFSPFIYGKGLPERDRDKKGKVPVYGSNGVVGRHTKAYVDNSGIIIGRKGTIGSINLSKEPFYPIDTSFYIEDEPQKRNLLYTYYLLKTVPLKINNDSAVPGLNRDYAHSIKIKIPPLPEQKAIAEILGALDDKIELNRKMNKTLEDMAQAVFKSWFMDFDLVKAKADGRTIKGLSQEILDLFPDSFVESELGDIPLGWKVEKIEELATIVRGGSPRPIHDFLCDDGLPWLKISDATSSSTKFINKIDQCIKKEGLNKTRFIKAGSLILSNSATPGIPKFLSIDSCIHDGWLYFSDYKNITKELLYYYLLFNREKIVSYGSGSVFTNLKTDILKNYKIIVPNYLLMDKINYLFKDFNILIEQNNLKIQTLSTIRDSLLPKLISGEIRVGEAEKILEGVV